MKTRIKQTNLKVIWKESSEIKPEKMEKELWNMESLSLGENFLSLSESLLLNMKSTDEFDMLQTPRSVHSDHQLSGHQVCRFLKPSFRLFLILFLLY